MFIPLIGCPFASNVAVGNDLSHIDAGVLLQILVEKGILTDAEVNRAIERSREQVAASAQPVAIHDHPPVPYEPTEPLGDRVVNTRVKRFGVEETDGSNRFRIRGRLMADFAYVNWDDAQNTIDGDLGSYGSIIRRARLGVLGIWNYDWEWQMEVDFRDAEIRFANAYIAYLGFDHARLAIGHFKEPFSMESSTSSRRLTFLERATPVDAYRPDREMGILYETLRENFYVGLGLYGGQSVASERRISEGYSIAGRASYALINEEDRFLHVGGSLNYRDNAYRSRPGRDKEYVDVRLRSREGARAVDGRLVGLNDIANVTDFNRMAFEFAKGYGPFAVQAEYVKVRVNRALNRESLDLGGYYVQAVYNLTGESHNYRATSGDFGLPRVNNPFGGEGGGKGTWQIAARFAKADSISKDYDGHKMDHYTIGLNWYPIPEIVFKFNYIYLDAENAAGRRTLANVYAFRAQLEF
jgi:phosphate-selective porin OprO/OprP